MKASELRIGNHVLKNGLANHVDIGIFMEIYYAEINNKNHGCEPIQLTEEWLLKFGFIPLDKYKLDFGFPTKDHVISKDGDKGWYYGFECYLVHLPVVELIYVHQLQNLYYALTGKELELIEPLN